MTIYLDNAATSWPKDPAVLTAMQQYLETTGGNPGRSGHSLSVSAARIVFEARDSLARLFNASSPERIIFTKNGTEALNMILFGVLGAGDHVITSSMEHNAVMRPLRHLEALATRLSVVRCDATGQLDPADIKKAITPKTKLIIMTHASNVTGTILPVTAVGAIAREAGVPFAVDAAQTAGCLPLDTQAACIDFLAFTGHKGLGGPQGTGGLVLGPDADLPPLLHGGTGSMSDFEYQPGFLPDKLESGTLNAIGIAGLGAAVRELEKSGVAQAAAHKQHLVRAFCRELAVLPGVKVFGPADPAFNAGVVSVSLAGLVCSEVGLALDKVFGILTRTGLHCAPAAHKTTGSFPQGTVRFSFGRFNTAAEVALAASALARISLETE